MGGSYGLLSLSRDGEPLTALEIEDKTFKVAWLAQTLHSAMVEKGRIVPTAANRLTPREYEVLCRLSEGWTAESIGNALSISTRTANHHIGNILRKLSAENRVQAIVTAISTGLLSI
jgi:DNA-binding NarL/FixJ family response regulator